MRFSPGPLLAHVMWPVALLPGSVLDFSKTLFPRWSLSVFLGIVYCRDHSWKTTVGANGSGLGPSIIQTLQCCCSRLGTLSQPAVLSQAPWELQYMPCFMPCDCYAGGLTTAFKHFEQRNPMFRAEETCGQELRDVVLAGFLCREPVLNNVDTSRSTRLGIRITPWPSFI